jgi:hypothetical protein
MRKLRENKPSSLLLSPPPYSSLLSTHSPSLFFFFHFFNLLLFFFDQSNCSGHPFAYVVVPPFASIVLRRSSFPHNRLGFRYSFSIVDLISLTGFTQPHTGAPYSPAPSHPPCADQCALPPSPWLL